VGKVEERPNEYSISRKKKLRLF